MNAVALLLIGLGLLAVGLYWSLPAKYAQNAVGLLTAIILIWVSPMAAMALLSMTILFPFAMRWGDTHDRKNLMLLLLGSALVAIFVSSRFMENYVWIGVAYFVLRLFHILIEWWSERIAAPALGNHFRYQFFLPVISSGPINRITHFEREIDRRSWSRRNFVAGAERCLIGLFFVLVISRSIIGRLEIILANRIDHWNIFLANWLLSAIDWVQLYFSFSGYTSIALGLSLMMGLRLEENFNHPYRATNLLDFWSRWHMTLTNWCRDYVYDPIAAATRNPVIAVFAAMLVLGLWHEFSFYYIFWAGWQSLGIIGTHLLLKHYNWRVPHMVSLIGGPIFVLSWLSLARPMATLILGDYG